MSAASSPVKSSNSKRLNPSALSYEPQSIPPIAKTHYLQDKIYLPHQFPLETNHYEAPLLLPQLSEPPTVVFSALFPDFCPLPGLPYDYSPWCWYNKGESLKLYNSEKQPHPRIKVFSSSNSVQNDGINYGSERVVWKKKKGKYGFVPPRLKPPREYTIDDRGQVPRKAGDEKIDCGSYVHGGSVPLSSAVTAEEKMKLDGKTSLMIRNIPNHFRRHQLQRMLDRHCKFENRKARPVSNFCKSAYDFLYLPMDFGFHLNLGFAFVNFTSPDAAVRFYRAFNNRVLSCGDRRKICEIGVAKFQGRDALKEQFQKSSFPCDSNEYLPVVFSPPRDGFIHPRPTLLGRRTRVSATSKGEKAMIMTVRKNKKA